MSKMYAVNQGCMFRSTYISWSMAAMSRDLVVVVVVRTRPRAPPLAMITMSKLIDGFPFPSNMSMVLRSAGLRAPGGPLSFHAFKR